MKSGEKHKGELSSVWLKAAVAGSLWASVEIIAGSFLHNLRVPFSGTVLSFISVYLMIAFSVIWKEKGLIIRAGLICALMKSISPSAIIFGPMIGIMSEAILLEGAIFLVGQNLPAYILGGSLAVFSAILHKAGSLLLMYGFNLLSLLNSMYDFASKQLNIEEVPGKYLLILISLIYLFSGSIAAIAGYRAGRKALSVKNIQVLSGIDLDKGRKLFEIPSKQKYAPYLLGIHLLMIITILYLLTGTYTALTLLLAGCYILFSILRYHSSMRYFKKPMFWISFIALTFLAGIFWNGFSTGSLFDPDGLWIGLRMNIRATIILLGFSAISVELRNPVIRTLLMNRGFSGLYKASGLAFSALPFSIGILPKGKELIMRPLNSFNIFFSYTDALLGQFEAENRQGPNIIMLSGDTGEGKSTFLASLLELLKKQGIKTGGFIARGIQIQGQRKGFDLEDIKTGEIFELCRDEYVEGRLQTGKYFFDPLAFEKGRNILINALDEQSKLIVIDEIGPLEMQGKGWAPVVEQILADTSNTMLLVVRRQLLKDVCKKWCQNEALLIDISSDDLDSALLKVMNIIRKNDHT